MSLRSVLLATATLCAYVADAHVLMKSPVPYSVDKLDNGPISKQQYPCKSQNGFTVSTMNSMAVGEKQTLTLSGSAVHGGGSCQLSVTLDTEPTASSVFKVIKSMEGGCPGVSGEAEAYDFTLPDSIPNGKATFAWTWFSKLSGGPELYMNCAPIEVTGGASDDTAFQKLPNMLVANIDDTCKSVPNFAVQFPDPGSVDTNGGTNDLKAPVGSGCGATGTTPADPSAPAGSGAPASSAAGGQASAAPSAGGNDGMYTPPAGAGATSAAATSAAAAPTSAAAVPTSAAGGAGAGASASAVISEPAATSAAATGGAGGVFAPGASSAAPVASTQTTLVTVTGTPSTPVKTTAAASKPAATTPAAGTGASGAAPTTAPAAGGSGSTACSTNGAIVCNGTSEFGLCNNGSVVFMPVAAGTTCTNGTIAKRAYNGRVVRRNRRSFVGHVHKH